MFNQQDVKVLQDKGISLEKAEWQLEKFRTGVKPAEIEAPATLEKGILKLDDAQKWATKYESESLKVTKFVPASGAASRMFKTLFEFRDALKQDPSLSPDTNEEMKSFFQHIRKFAFYSDLSEVLKEEGPIDRLIAGGKYQLILNSLLEKQGLSYGNLPKGLLKFHFYAGKIARTPFEEHLVEGSRYARSANNMVNLHFTVSPEHLSFFQQLKDMVLVKYENMYRVNYHIDFSIQKSSTDTLAVQSDNSPFYDQDKKLLFRPGGHGALIENLNEIDADIIFIKNIDNVVPEKKINATLLFKKALAGILLETQKNIFKLIKALKEKPDSDTILKAAEFVKQSLCISVPGQLENETEWFIKILNRPLRVCGMVRNTGEPGGGPFLVKDKNGVVSTQILESSQVDLNNPKQAGLFAKATHFNPVDLVCAVRDYEGNKFNLKDFIDEDTCFISIKSKDGKELKALELPGLWNGAMAGWNTLFVEVPISTFNPVKTVNDLLREAHQ